jgi:hypothetical protein
MRRGPSNPLLPRGDEPRLDALVAGEALSKIRSVTAFTDILVALW